MNTVLLSSRARADLRGIWNYSMEHWGNEQAERYIARFHQAFWALATNPRRALPATTIQPGFRKYRVGAHIIFFRTTDDGIEVVRVLHQNMDFEQHL